MNTETTIELPPIFAACCGEATDMARYQKPFPLNGFTYATDGRIVVRIAGEHVPAIKDPTAADTVPWDGTRLPPVALTRSDDATIKCSECGGDGKSHRRECDECAGTGMDECLSCGHDCDCEECKGTGWIGSDSTDATCEECGGKGVVRNTKGSVNYGAFHLSSHYGNLLLDHGVTHVEPDAAGPSNRPVLFRLGEVVGMLMPTNPNP